MRKFTIGGMSCAACSARVEKAVNALDGVSSCTVNLLTNTMMLEGEVDDATVIAAVTRAGYSATSEHVVKNAQNKEIDDPLADRETPRLRARLISSLIFLALLMYVSMGHKMFAFPLPERITENHLGLGLIELVLTIIIMVINQKFFVSGYSALIKRSPNMDTLVALGATAAFVYSTCILYLMTEVSHDSALLMHYSHEFYFEAAATILTLITLGKMLEARAKGKTTDAIRSLMKLSPDTATVIRDGKETVVPIEKLLRGDIFLVRPGESIPADGVVVDGFSAVNEAALTGESIPVDKTVGDRVSAATINSSGFLKCEATGVGEDTAISKIIAMVSDAAATKAPIAKIADKVSGIFVPTVMSIAAITLAVWLILGESVGFALARAISVLVISCPCALGLATPVAIMVGSGVGAKHGILFKTAEALEHMGKVKTVCLDKTGTVTKGVPSVTDILPTDGNERELLAYAGSLEHMSEHPLSRAVINKCEDLKTELYKVSDFTVVPGKGLCGKIGTHEIFGGSLGYIKGICEVSKDTEELANSLAKDGKTPLLFAKDNKLMGIIAVADEIREDSACAIKELYSLGLRVVMLTGDNKRTASAVGNAVGIKGVIAEVLPGEKQAEVKKLSSEGLVCMVGDGINDAPALTAADVGIAIGAGVDVAIDSADVVLIQNSLSDVANAVKLSRKTIKNIRENLFWAFIYNVIGIPIAAGALVGVGLTMNPMFGAAAMSLSSFCVVVNALRLNFFKTKNASDYNNCEIKENKTVETKIKIEGMMCAHCSDRVKKVLEAMDGVISADVSHENGCAVVKSKCEIDFAEFKNIIEAEGYKVICKL